MANWTGSLSVLIYIVAAVLVVVAGQTDLVDQLSNAVTKLQTELAKAVARSEQLEREQAELSAELTETMKEITSLQEDSSPNRPNRKLCGLSTTTLQMSTVTI